MWLISRPVRVYLGAFALLLVAGGTFATFFHREGGIDIDVPVDQLEVTLGAGSDNVGFFTEGRKASIQVDGFQSAAFTDVAVDARKVSVRRLAHLASTSEHSSLLVDDARLSELPHQPGVLARLSWSKSEPKSVVIHFKSPEVGRVGIFSGAASNLQCLYCKVGPAPAEGVLRQTTASQRIHIFPRSRRLSVSLTPAGGADLKDTRILLADGKPISFSSFEDARPISSIIANGTITFRDTQVVQPVSRGDFIELVAPTAAVIESISIDNGIHVHMSAHVKAVRIGTSPDNLFNRSPTLIDQIAALPGSSARVAMWALVISSIAAATAIAGLFKPVGGK